MIERLNPTKDRAGTCELFMDSPANHNSLLFYQGILQVLQPYLDEGSLSIPSGRVAFEDCCITEWTADSALQAFQRRLQCSSGQVADVYLCASDHIAAGVIRGREQAGASRLPLVTGNGATEEGFALLNSDKLTLTVRTNGTDPVNGCCLLVDRALFGTEPEGLHTVFNNAIDVPTVFCGFEILEK